MSLTVSKKTETHVTFIFPYQFEFYSKRGYVIYMNELTAFGTYKAVKITVVSN